MFCYVLPQGLCSLFSLQVRNMDKGQNPRTIILITPQQNSPVFICGLHCNLNNVIWGFSWKIKLTKAQV